MTPVLKCRKWLKWLQGFRPYSRIEASLEDMLLPRAHDIADSTLIGQLRTSLKQSHWHLKQVLKAYSCNFCNIVHWGNRSSKTRCRPPVESGSTATPTHCRTKKPESSSPHAVTSTTREHSFISQIVTTSRPEEAIYQTIKESDVDKLIFP